MDVPPSWRREAARAGEALFSGTHIEEILGESKTSKTAIWLLVSRMNTRLRLVLFQPDIPQNAGALLRLAACLNLVVDIIEPCGFTLSDRRLRRVGLDYLERASLPRHNSWPAFQSALQSGQSGQNRRLLLLTTRGDTPYCDFLYKPGDSLMVGRESAGVPQDVHEACDARLRIPLQDGARSLNVATAAAIVLGEALRQTGLFPEGAP